MSRLIAAALADDEAAPFEWCGGGGRSASSGSITGSAAAGAAADGLLSLLGEWRAEDGSDMMAGGEVARDAFGWVGCKWWLEEDGEDCVCREAASYSRQ